MQFKHCQCQLPRARDVGGLTQAPQGLLAGSNNTRTLKIWQPKKDLDPNHNRAQQACLKMSVSWRSLPFGLDQAHTTSLRVQSCGVSRTKNTELVVEAWSRQWRLCYFSALLDFDILIARRLSSIGRLPDEVEVRRAVNKMRLNHQKMKVHVHEEDILVVMYGQSKSNGLQPLLTWLFTATSWRLTC